MVWFSGMWLAIGLLMIVTLLVVIVKNGLTLFWPSEVVQIELVEGSKASIQGASTLAGEVRKRQDKRVLDAEGNVIPELQLFVGNRDAYVFGFRYVDQSDIASQVYPEDIIVAERIEYWDIIGYPVSMKLADGVINADAPYFRQRFESVVGLSNDRRHEI